MGTSVSSAPAPTDYPPPRRWATKPQTSAVNRSSCPRCMTITLPSCQSHAREPNVSGEVAIRACKGHHRRHLPRAGHFLPCSGSWRSPSGRFRRGPGDSRHPNHNSSNRKPSYFYPCSLVLKMLMLSSLACTAALYDPASPLPHGSPVAAGFVAAPKAISAAPGGGCCGGGGSSSASCFDSSASKVRWCSVASCAAADAPPSPNSAPTPVHTYPFSSLGLCSSLWFSS